MVSFLTNFLFFVSNVNSQIYYRHGDRINVDTVWSGNVIIEGTLFIDKGVLLKVNPGAKVLFKKLDVDKDGVSESTIISSGTIDAVGEKENPIYFTSVEPDKKWGDWKEIQINHAKNIRFEYCVFEYAEYALHVHFSEGLIKNSIFRFNSDGTRIGNSKLVIERNLFEKNVGKALNFTSSKLLIYNNTIRDNRDGLFVFEKSDETIIKRNNIYNNFSNIKLGDFFKGNLYIGETFINKTSELQEGIHIDIIKEPFLDALPDMKDAYVIFHIDTEGFVDGGVTISNELAYIPSFDNNIYEINLNSYNYGKIYINDFSDASPAVDDRSIYIVNWDGIIMAIDKFTKNVIWKDRFKRSLKDDHRMAGPVLSENLLIVVSPGGHLKIYQKFKGKIVFEKFLEGEFRASPLVLDKRIFMVSVSGEVYSISLKDYRIYKKKFNSKFYSSPVFHKNYIYVLGSEGKLYVFDKDLNIKNIFEIKGSFRYQSPVVFKDRVILCSLDGYIIEIGVDNNVDYKKTNYIFTASPGVYKKSFIVIPSFQGDLVVYDGSKIFSVGNFGEIQFSPVFYKDRLVLGTRNNKIYVIKFW